jgi:nucleotide-binding universal stress UspA family protein
MMVVRGLEAYHRILVPVSETRDCDEAMAIACRLAADRGATVTVLTAIEVPPGLPLEAQMPDDEAEARGVVGEARAIAELYGVRVEARVVRGRAAGEAIVAAATERGAELVVLGAPRKRRASPRAPVFGRTVAFVLAQAPCRVMVAAPPPHT